jgi:hypothetical protein
MCGQLDVFVSPLRRSVDARDETGPVQPAEVAVDERVSRLRVVRSAFGQPEVPVSVFLPRVGFEEGVLVLRARLNVAPVALEDVLPRLDQPAGMADGAFVDGVRSDLRIVTSRRLRAKRRAWGRADGNSPGGVVVVS